MTYEIVSVPIANLLLYGGNARLRDEQTTQQAALLALAEQQGNKLLSLARDIVDHGIDPSALPIVIPSTGPRNQYVVLEGNRRVAVLKGLETPSLISHVFDGPGKRRFAQLAKDYSTSPLSELGCVVFTSEKDAEHWIKLRHTGQNEGAGLVEWGSEEKDRYATRHGKRSEAGQLLEFVANFGALSPEASGSRKGINTSLIRLLSTPDVRKALGIDLRSGVVHQLLTTEYVAKAASRVIEDLKTGRLKVGDIYTRDDRIKYAEALTTELSPENAARLPDPVPLGEGTPPPNATTSKSQRRRPAQGDRTTPIPKDCVLKIASTRIHAIYKELTRIKLSDYPNACAVLMRVFLELSVDHYLTHCNLMAEEVQRNTVLAKRMKEVAEDLLAKAKISRQLRDAIQKIADNESVIAASTTTFNRYVHNRFVHPKPTELGTAWDELQPFMEAMWP
ncbi:MAG TPA: hypothetical protein VFJ58_24000 [Armatimonadota bacterium]|nr:hypothetical protein [Armatimonadota bacterium]